MTAAASWGRHCFSQTLKVCDVRKAAPAASTPPPLCLWDSGEFLSCASWVLAVCSAASEESVRRSDNACLGRSHLRWTPSQEPKKARDGGG